MRVQGYIQTPIITNLAQQNLRSAEEMEEEEKAAQSAKLQELIRRGSPHDLQQANKLMKVMAGFDNRHKTDYRAKAAEEVGKIQQKARLLEEMLQNYRAEDAASDEGSQVVAHIRSELRFVRSLADDAQELSNALASAQPKIQKMCEEESEDTEAVAKLFEINDSIHRTLERYRLTRTGDLEAAAKIPKGTLGTSGAGVSKGPGNELSLIDLGSGDSNGASAASTQGGNAGIATSGQQQQGTLENDLLGLSLAGDAQNAGGQISLGGAISPQPQGVSSVAAKQNIMDSFNMPHQTASAQPQTQSYFQSPPPQQQNPPSYTPLQPPAQPTQTQPQISTPQHPNVAILQSQTTPQASAQSASDPFAALSGPSIRSSSPFQYQQSARPLPPPTSLASATHVQQPQTNFNPTGTAVSSGADLLDDDWAFSSALPDASHEITVVNSSIHLSFLVSRPPNTTNEFLIKSTVSNTTASLVSDFTFQAAVLKVCLSLWA